MSLPQASSRPWTQEQRAQPRGCPWSCCSVRTGRTQVWDVRCAAKPGDSGSRWPAAVARLTPPHRSPPGLLSGFLSSHQTGSCTREAWSASCPPRRHGTWEVASRGSSRGRGGHCLSPHAVCFFFPPAAASQGSSVLTLP